MPRIILLPHHILHVVLLAQMPLRTVISAFIVAAVHTREYPWRFLGFIWGNRDDDLCLARLGITQIVVLENTPVDVIEIIGVCFERMGDRALPSHRERANMRIVLRTAVYVGAAQHRIQLAQFFSRSDLRIQSA